MGTFDDQVGHVDPSGFVLVTRQDRIRKMQIALTERLSKAFNYFYPIRDIQTGQITAPMRIEMGVTTVADGPFAHPQAIIEAVIGVCYAIDISQAAKA